MMDQDCLEVSSESPQAEPGESPEEARIRVVNSQFWIGHSRAKALLEVLDALIKYPKCQRMPNLAIVGDSNCGKSLLLKRFCDRHVPPPDPYAERTDLPILVVGVPSRADENRFYDEVLEHLFAEGSCKEPIGSKTKRIRELLTKLRTRMLIIDEFNHAIAGPINKQREFLNGLKILGNKLQIPIVVAGTMETQSVLRSDPSIANRFPSRVISKWTFNYEFQQLLASIEKRMALNEKSNLGGERMAKRILALSEGTIGEVLAVIRILARVAILDGSERIRFEQLKVSYLKTLGWVPPSER